jgi:hypothetical protein
MNWGVGFKLAVTFKSVAGLLVFAGVLASGSAFAQSNLIANGGFENGAMAPWKSWSKLRLVSWGAHSGSRALYTENSGGGDVIVSVTPGQTYTFTAFGRTDRAGYAAIGYKFLNSAWRPIGSEVQASSFNTYYEQRSLTFTVPSGAARVQLTLWNSSGGGMYLDDTSLTSGGAAVASTGGAVSGGGSTSSGSLNNVSTVVADMTQMNDAALKLVNPAYGFARGPGYVVQGATPKGTHVPRWISSNWPSNYNYGWWNYILPWFVQFEGYDNQAYNTRIQIRNLKLWIQYKSTNAWRLQSNPAQFGGQFCAKGGNYQNCYGGNNTRSESSGGLSFKPNGNNDFHGWFGNRSQYINGWDIKAVMVTFQSRLIVDNPAYGDDRARARYLLNIGADYYPTSSGTPGYLPSVGMSRAKMLKDYWQPFTMMTFSDRGVQDPGGGVTEAQFRGNHPTFD